MARDDKKKRLMDAAIAFVQAGETPTTRRLVERAGVNISAINYYFQGKDNLMAEALDQAALADLDLWIETNLIDDLPTERLLHFCRYLARIHLKFWTFSHAQLSNVILKGREERATARAIAELRRLCIEARTQNPNNPTPEDTYAAAVSAVSLMSSLHYVSIFHPHFETMSKVAIGDEDALYRYVDELLAQHGLRTASSNPGTKT